MSSTPAETSTQIRLHAEETGVAVLVSLRVDPHSGRATRSQADSAAVALAQQALAGRAEPWLLSAGELPEAVARGYLALGVRRLTQLSFSPQAVPVGPTGPAGPGLAQVAATLARACQRHALVLAGPRAESGPASGLLPYALGQALNWPVLDEVVDLQPETGGGWRVLQALPRGARRAWLIGPGCQAVLITSPRLLQRGDLLVRHAWAAAQAGCIETLPAESLAPPPRPIPAVAWQFEPARKQRRPLAAASRASGADRMARATGAAAASGRGGVLIQEGSAQDKARLLLEHLRKLSLVAPPLACPGDGPTRAS